MLTTIIIFVLVLGVLVFVHELGHFLVARKSGMVVEEFGFGFPPRLVGLQKIDKKWKIIGVKAPDPEHTVYSINWIPFGAFVRIRGENGDSIDEKSFTRGKWWKRFSVLVAGVFMNVLMAWALFSLGLAIGVPAGDIAEVPKYATYNDVQARISDVRAGLPADRAGLLAGDAITAVNSIPVKTPEEVQSIVANNAGKEITLNIKRGQELLQLKVTPENGLVEGRAVVGMQLALVGTLKYAWYYAPIAGVQVTAQQLAGIAKGLYGLITAGVGIKDIAGPAKIAQYTGQAAKLGFGYLLQFSAFLSLNLAVLNILPFPALDGGRVLFLIIEKIRGRALNKNFEQWANAVGFLVLLLLVAVVTVNDVRNFEFVKNAFK